MSVKKFVIAATFLIPAPAWADEGDDKFFIEAGMGLSNSITDLQFYNPTGANFTLSEISPDKKYIFLTALDNRSASLNAYGSVG